MSFHAPVRRPVGRSFRAALHATLALALGARVDAQPPAPTSKAPTSKAPTSKASPARATAKRHTPGDSARKPSKPTPVWPVANAPAPLPGSLLPAKRIVAYYGNPLSKRMGVLGELPQAEMLAKLDREVAKWNAADPSHPVQPALHLIATVAQGTPGKDGTYRYRVHPDLIEKVYSWARARHALLFLDVQIGTSTLEEELKVLVPYLQRPDVHLGIDPEFAMTKGGLPGRRVGTYDAKHINYAIDLLGNLVTQYRLPPKVLIVHRFTGPMVTNSAKIELDPRVQVVMNMDGWGPPYGKRATWSRYIYPYPVQYTGFKLFYHNDTKAGHPLMSPKDVLALFPAPLYIQYQ